MLSIISIIAVGQEDLRSPHIQSGDIDSITYYVPIEDADLLNSRLTLGSISDQDLSKTTTDCWFTDVYVYNDDGDLAYIQRKAKGGLDVILYGQQLQFGVDHKIQRVLNRAERTDTIEIVVYNFSHEPLTFSVADNILDYFCCIEGSITLQPQSDSTIVLSFTVNPGRFVRELFFFGEDFIAVEEVFSGGYHLTASDFEHPERRIVVPNEFYYYHSNDATQLEVRDPVSHDLLFTYNLHKPWTKVKLKDIALDRVFITLVPELSMGDGSIQKALMVDLDD